MGRSELRRPGEPAKTPACCSDHPVQACRNPRQARTEAGPGKPVSGGGFPGRPAAGDAPPWPCSVARAVTWGGLEDRCRRRTTFACSLSVGMDKPTLSAAAVSCSRRTRTRIVVQPASRPRAQARSRTGAGTFVSIGCRKAEDRTPRKQWPRQLGSRTATGTGADAEGRELDVAGSTKIPSTGVRMPGLGSGA